MRQHIAIAIGLAALLVGWGALGFAQEELTRPEVHTERGIRYVSGGIGQGERDMLRQTAKEYNLKLVFAVKQGNYLSNVHVVIWDNRNNVVLDTVTEGPWLYVDVPAGKYTMTATAYEQAKQQVAQVSEAGQSEVRFYWTAPSGADFLWTRETEVRR